MMLRRAAMGIVLVIVASACSGDGQGEDRNDADPRTETNETTETTPMSDIDLAAETYVTGYPLVVSIRTMQRLGGLVGVNQLFWQTSLSGPQSRTVVAPNRDTLYSFAVLDLRSEPMALTLPEVTDRYYTYQLLDAWTESFAYIGTRATDGRAGTWVITAPGWEGDVPDGAEVIEATTPQVFLLGRYLVDDEADVANVTAISRQVSLQPLSSLTGSEAAPPPPPLGEPAGTAQDIPTDAGFFDELGDALAVNPPTAPVQQDLFARAETLGIGPGEHPAEAADIDPDQLALLDDGAALGDEKIDTGASEGAEAVDGWGANLHVGRYGDDTLLRAVVARVGWGANVPEEAVYPLTQVDADGTPLDGANSYRITFPAGELPPVDAFWSLTVYGPDMFLVENPSGRYAIGDRTPGLAYGDDGSLEVVLSATEPAAAEGGDGGGEPVNWLPVPEGPFVLMLRLYLPGQEVLDGDYHYPPVERIAASG